MTYAVQPAPPAAPRRPASVGFAAALLIVMAVVGLAYAVVAVTVAPGTVDRFRAAAGAGEDVDGMVTVLWIIAAMGAILAIILFALYVVLALGLRRGSNGMRIASLVVCGLGVFGGCASATTTALQNGGGGASGSLGRALSDAYPDSWLTLNVGLGLAQLVGYVLVAVLLLVAPREFFGKAPKPAQPAPFVPGAVAGSGYGAAPAGFPQGVPVYGAPYPSAPGVVPPGVGLSGAAHPALPGAAHPALPGAAHPAFPGAAHPALPGAAHPASPEEPSPWAAPRPMTPTAPEPVSDPSPARPSPSVTNVPPATISVGEPRGTESDSPSVAPESLSAENAAFPSTVAESTSNISEGSDGSESASHHPDVSSPEQRSS
ncbi:hypothetical protein [Actinoplanes sp. NPDC051859]|uniref:hypothetical protein n=1 Tax=Actinoplanes sp. NPDC051859 TaxID=3363909 RepID=UPI00378F90C0